MSRDHMTEPKPDSHTKPNPFMKPVTLFTVIFSKLVFNSTIRFLTPFVAYFSEDMDISVEKFSLTILLIGEASSIFALGISRKASKLETKKLALICCINAGLANVLVLALPSTLKEDWSLIILCAFRLWFGIFFNLMNSCIQSSLVNNVSPTHVGKMTGIVESSWTLGAFTFALVGVLLKVFGWKGPFVVNGVLMLISAPCLHYVLPPDIKKDPINKININLEETLNAEGGKEELTVRETVCSMQTFGLFGSLVLRDTGMFLVLTTYSLWLEEKWGMGSEEAGLASLVIAVGELTAVICMSTLSDRIGIQLNLASVNFAIVLSTIAFGLFENSNLSVSIAFLGISFFFFEWGAICVIAYTGSNYHNEVRVTMLAILYTTMAASRSLAAAIVEPIYRAEGLQDMKGVAMICGAMQLFGACLFFFTRDWKKAAKGRGDKMNWSERI
ncbi:hypothetical protein TL16_g07064 [Triparma laevis f. inornata]|uniref:Major facilitator superfamily (MFS) profile domain-containing protein n=2 Tax=Triparma laevis TaxID=1534972 RepID=A0A9W6Z4T0_9STRA|nr:hypothetical protein TrLO_g865 [Triparma laevis f. longispina]GMH76398.1 hypothetical protein TL16_g07064 [Triparma laevis f. inornata]